MSQKIIKIYIIINKIISNLNLYKSIETYYSKTHNYCEENPK